MSANNQGVSKMSKLIPTGKWDPFVRMGEDFEGLFESIFNMPSFTANRDFQKFTTDISETENEYIISSDLPGIKKEDIKIELKEGYLTIKAERKEEKEEKDKKYYRRERVYGNFVRNIALPENAESDERGINAEFKDGVLNIVIPKRKVEKEAEKTKFIEIK